MTILGEPTVGQISNSERSTEQETRNGASGRGWHGDPQGHAEAGSAGGQKVAEDRTHMSQIGKKGGQSVSRNRAHMAEIGRKGGLSRTATALKQREQGKTDEDTKND